MADSLLLGISCCLFSGLFFGSDLLPVKKVDCGDGFLFSCWMSVGIWLVGLVVDFTLASKEHSFEPLAMLGGAIWLLGNALTLLSTVRIGLSLQYLVSGTTNMLTGWATGHFGLFGVHRDRLANPLFNWLGLGLLTVALALLSQVGDEGDLKDEAEDIAAPLTSEETIHKQPPSKARFLLGFTMALSSGFFLGSNFDIPIMLQQQGPGAGHSANAVDYAFSHYSGILAAAAICALLYLAYMQQSAHVKAEVIFPAIISGAMWGVAQTAWFKANELLSLSVTFPIVNTLVPLIGTFWGACLFGEIKTRRNRVIVGGSLFAQIPGILLVALSRKNA